MNQATHPFEGEGEDDTCLICQKPRLSVYHPGTMRGPCANCGDAGWCVHRKVRQRARSRMAELPAAYRPTVHKPQS